MTEREAADPPKDDERAERLHDALQQLVDWVKDGCSDEMRTYCMTEAQAALKGISVVGQPPITDTPSET